MNRWDITYAQTNTWFVAKNKPFLMIKTTMDIQTKYSDGFVLVEVEEGMDIPSTATRVDIDADGVIFASEDGPMLVLQPKWKME